MKKRILEGSDAVRLNTKYSIALHCMVFIAEYENIAKVTSELLGKSTGCNAAAVRSILNSLKKAGLITVRRGVGGAYLNLSPENITLWDVFSAVDPDGLKHFIGLHPNPYEKCPVGSRIEYVLKKPYEEIGNTVKASMEKITLQELMDYYHSED